jgi:hypothetical protein
VKLLADQDVYGVTTKWLRGKGHNVVTARELSNKRLASSWCEATPERLKKSIESWSASLRSTKRKN